MEKVKTEDTREFTLSQIVKFAKRFDITIDKAIEWIFDSNINPSELV